VGSPPPGAAPPPIDGFKIQISVFTIFYHGCHSIKEDPKDVKRKMVSTFFLTKNRDSFNEPVRYQTEYDELFEYEQEISTRTRARIFLLLFLEEKFALGLSFLHIVTSGRGQKKSTAFFLEARLWEIALIPKQSFS